MAQTNNALHNGPHIYKPGSTVSVQVLVAPAYVDCDDIAVNNAS